MSNVIRLPIEDTRAPAQALSNLEMTRNLDNLMRAWAQYLVVRLTNEPTKVGRSRVKRAFKGLQKFRKNELDSLFAHDVCHSQPVGDSHVR